MSETTPTFPGFEPKDILYKYEWNEKEKELIRSLREKGPADSDTKKMLSDWIDAEEKRVENSADPIAAILLNLRRARLYYDAGFLEEAWENFESARRQAWNENHDELSEKIGKEMDSLGL